MASWVVQPKKSARKTRPAIEYSSLVGAQFPTEILGQFANGHHFQEGMPKDSLPTLGDDPLTGRGYDALEGVEEAILSGVDHVDHNGRNSCYRIWLSL